MGLTATVPGSWYNISAPIDTGYSSLIEGSSASAAGSGGSAFGGIGTGFQLGSAIGGIVSSFIGAKAQSYVQKVQADINKNNAKIAQIGVEQAYRQGEAQIAKITRGAKNLKGKQKTAMAANGVAVGVGSMAEILASTDIQKEEDVQTARLNTIAQAYGYKTQAATYGAQSSALSSMASYNGGIGAYGSAFSSFLDSAPKVAKSWYSLYGD